MATDSFGQIAKDLLCEAALVRKQVEKCSGSVYEQQQLHVRFVWAVADCNLNEEETTVVARAIRSIHLEDSDRCLAQHVDDE